MKANRSSTTHSEGITHSRISGHGDHARRFLTVRFLEQIPRPMLELFFDRFRDECERSDLTFRSTGSNADYYFHLRCVLAQNPDLPPSLTEALRTIHQMATPEAHQRFTSMLGEQPSTFHQRFDRCTAAELAMHIWLNAPTLFAQAEAEVKLLRLTLFKYFVARNAAHVSGHLDLPPVDVLRSIQADLDAWFASHFRGEETVQLHLHQLHDEFWFLIRHGGIFSRRTAVQRRATGIVRFRPAKDDVAVYTPSRNELRIHAATEGEINLYRQVLGRRLFGDAEHFSDHNVYTLAPLRLDGSRSLESHDVPGITRVRLAEIEFETAFHGSVVEKLNETSRYHWPAISGSAALMRAIFEVFFSGEPRPRKIEICPPNQLRLPRHCHSHLVQDWLGKRGFRSVGVEDIRRAVNILPVSHDVESH
jgi:hypothetical protein